MAEIEHAETFASFHLEPEEGKFLRLTQRKPGFRYVVGDDPAVRTDADEKFMMVIAKADADRKSRFPLTRDEIRELHAFLGTLLQN